MATANGAGGPKKKALFKVHDDDDADALPALEELQDQGSGIRRSHSAAFARPEFKAMQAGFSRFRDEFRYEDAAAAPRVRAMQIVDVYHAGKNRMEVDLGKEQQEEREFRETLRELTGFRGFLQRIYLQFKYWLKNMTDTPQMFLILFLVGFCVALTGILMDIFVRAFVGYRKWMVDGAGFFGGYVIWVLWCPFFAWLGTAVGPFLQTSNLADGSFIPQLRSILSGTSMPQFFHGKVGLAKLLGVTFGLISGVYIGREGPLVHFAAVLAAQFWELPFFRMIATNESLQRQILAASAGAGVITAWRAPVSGVLFGVESTSTYYQVSNLWRSFLLALSAVFTFDLFNSFRSFRLFNPTEFDYKTISWELFAYIFAGVLCGFLGAFIVYLLRKVVTMRKIIIKQYGIRGRYGLVVAVATVHALLTYPFLFTRKTDRDVINDMFKVPSTASSATDAGSILDPCSGAGGNATTDPFLSSASLGEDAADPFVMEAGAADGGDLGDSAGYAGLFGHHHGGRRLDVVTDPATLGLSDWALGNSILISLVIFFVIRLLSVPLCVGLPMPCGLVAPVFAFGAGFGRLFGEILARALPDAGIVPAQYAAIAAAAISAAATQTMSPFIIVMEINGQMSHMLPVLLGTVTAYTIAGMLSPSSYDVLTSLLNLPHLAKVHNASYYFLTAGDIMHRELRCLSLQSTYIDAYVLLQMESFNGADGQRLDEIPVVDSLERLNLVGSVSRSVLVDVFAQHGGMGAVVDHMRQQNMWDSLAKLRDTMAERVRVGEEDVQHMFSNIAQSMATGFRRVGAEAERMVGAAGAILPGKMGGGGGGGGAEAEGRDDDALATPESGASSGGYDVRSLVPSFLGGSRRDGSSATGGNRSDRSDNDDESSGGAIRIGVRKPATAKTAPAASTTAASTQSATTASQTSSASTTSTTTSATSTSPSSSTAASAAPAPTTTSSTSSAATTPDAAHDASAEPSAPVRSVSPTRTASSDSASGHSQGHSQGHGHSHGHASRLPRRMTLEASMAPLAAGTMGVMDSSAGDMSLTSLLHSFPVWMRQTIRFDGIPVEVLRELEQEAASRADKHLSAFVDSTQSALAPHSPSPTHGGGRHGESAATAAAASGAVVTATATTAATTTTLEHGVAGSSDAAPASAAAAVAAATLSVVAEESMEEGGRESGDEEDRPRHPPSATHEQSHAAVAHPPPVRSHSSELSHLHASSASSSSSLHTSAAGSHAGSGHAAHASRDAHHADVGSHRDDSARSLHSVPSFSEVVRDAKASGRSVEVGLMGLPLGSHELMPPLAFDPAPLQLTEHTPVTKVHYLFAICLFSQMFVSRKGKLVGIIMKEDLINPHKSATAKKKA